MRVAYFGPWYGEFGWELMAWQAWCRQESRQYDKSYVCSFPDMEALYTDFAEFIPHSHPGRALNWTDIDKIEYTIPDDVTDHIKPVKSYRLGGEFIKFGNKTGKGYNLLIHARGISRGSSKNYLQSSWEEIVEYCDDIACIGSEGDQLIEGTRDLRGIQLQNLMDIISCSRLVVGQSSGVMHMASLCGTPHIVWGDDRTYFNETLQKRYEETWNPLKTPVDFIVNNAWRPPAQDIVEAIDRRLGMGKQQIDVGEILARNLASAMESGKWLVTVSYRQADGKLKHSYETHDFEFKDILPSIENVRQMIMREVELREPVEGTTPEEPEETGWH